MRQRIVLLLILLIVFSCTNENNKHKDIEANQTINATPLAPITTYLDSLPSSAQPKINLLSELPKPIVIASKAPTEVTILPALVNERNQVIKDKNGNQFILGDGGISNFTNLTTDNGLSLDAIPSAYYDHLGILWFGTMGGGVCRYDGANFTNFTTVHGLANDIVVSINEDKKDNLWFCTQGGGVSRYNGRSFVTYTTEHGLAHNIVWCITQDTKNNLWFGTSGGVSVFDGTSFKTFTASPQLAKSIVRIITEDRNGNIWFGTDGNGVTRYDGKEFKTYTTTQGLANNVVRSIVEDSRGLLWMGTEGGGVSKFDHNTFTNYTMQDGLANNIVSSINEDKDGNIWFATMGGGVSRYDAHLPPGQGKSFQTFTTQQGLANNTVSSSTKDANGNLWFGTMGGGVSRYGGKAFISFSKKQGLANNTVWSIAEDKTGNLWFGTGGGGVSCFDQKSFKNYTTSQGLPLNTINCIIQDKKGNLWLGTSDRGISMYDGESFTNYTSEQGLANNSVWNIAEDKTGNIWMSTSDGISCFNGKSFTNFTTVQGLALNSVWCILEEKNGNLWFGTDGGGASCFDGKSFVNFTTAQGLADNTVLNIIQDKMGNLWFCTSKGLSLMSSQKLKELSENIKSTDKPDKPILNLFENITTNNGLPDNYVTQLVEADNGKIYAGTNLGICEILSTPSGNFVVGLTYNVKTGYPIKDVNIGQNCMFKDSRGFIWIATGSDKTALVRFNPKAMVSNKIPPEVIIQKIKVNEENINWYDLKPSLSDSITNSQQEIYNYGRLLLTKERDSLQRKYSNIKFKSIANYYPIPEELTLPYRHNSISFDFIALAPGASSSIRYQYILQGYSKQWSPITEKTSANFGNIYEGTYTFLVKAQNREGLWSSPVTYTFEVLPPWWRTWWAYSLFVITILGFVGYYIKWRESSLKERQRILEQVVEERTADVVSEKKKSDDLLLNILPHEVAEELKTKGYADAQLIDEVTVLFTDFKDFTQLSEKFSPQQLVTEINKLFSAFDKIMQKFGVEKIKTIGDSYMAAGGLPTPNKTHATDVVKSALEIQAFMKEYNNKREAAGELFFEIRIGINTGPVVAGIVGIKKFQYDIWGDTVNLASRMESSCEAGKVNVSGATFDLVKDKFDCTYRGKIKAKNKGEIDMYFVDQIN